jgi:hypothetical protein
MIKMRSEKIDLEKERDKKIPASTMYVMYEPSHNMLCFFVTLHALYYNARNNNGNVQ